MTPLSKEQTAKDPGAAAADNSENGKAKKRRRNRKKNRSKKSKAATVEAAQEEIDSDNGSKNQVDSTDTVQGEELVVIETMTTTVKKGAAKKSKKAEHAVVVPDQKAITAASKKVAAKPTTASVTKKVQKVAAISTCSSVLGVDEFETVLSYSQFGKKPSSSSTATVPVQTAPIPPSEPEQRVIQAALSTLSNGIVASSSHQAMPKKEIISDSLTVDEGLVGLSYSSLKTKTTKPRKETIRESAPSPPAKEQGPTKETTQATEPSPPAKERGISIGETDSPSVETSVDRVGSIQQSMSPVASLSDKPVPPPLSSSVWSVWGAFPSLSLKLQPQYYSTFLNS